jgi:uncharacterized membrane protein
LTIAFWRQRYVKGGIDICMINMTTVWTFKMFIVSVVINMLDDKIKMKQAVHLMDTGMVGGAFWGILIGMFALFLLTAKWTEDKALERLNKFKEMIK